MQIKEKNMKFIKLIIYILTIVLIVNIVQGCRLFSQPLPDPEKTVQDFWSALKSGDHRKASAHVYGEDLLVVAGDLPLSLFDEGSVVGKYGQEYFARIDLATESHKIEDSTAEVRVRITWPDLGVLLPLFIPEAMEVAFGAVLGGATGEQLEPLLGPLLLEALEGTPDIEAFHRVALVLVEGEWKLKSSPLPYASDAFDLSYFNEEGPAWPEEVKRKEEPGKNSVFENIREKARKDWPQDRSMQDLQYREQVRSYKNMEDLERHPEIIARVILDWPDDYIMQEYHYWQQLDSKEFMQALDSEHPEIIARVILDWPDDYIMQEYAYKEQVRAKRFMETIPDEDPLKQKVLEQWPDDYILQEFNYMP